MAIHIQALAPQVTGIIAGILLGTGEQTWQLVATMGANEVRVEARSSPHSASFAPVPIVYAKSDTSISWLDKSFVDWLTLQAFIIKWHNERGRTSLTREIVLCESYQRIIAMGESVIPLILRQLASEGQNPDHWFWALRALTGEDPVPAELRGNRKRMAQIWLEWGKLNNGMRSVTLGRPA